jgi:peptidyl-prolyl cis-trans isomerase SurA
MSTRGKPRSKNGSPSAAQLLAGALLLAAAASPAGPASAQLFPQGVTVTTTGPIQAVPAPVTQPPAAAKPKPKPKPAPTTASVAPDQAKPAQSIVMLVNDEPITVYEVEMRTRFMAASTPIGPQAQETFKRLIASEQTNDKLKAIFEATVREAQTKKLSREQFTQLFEIRKRDFAVGLQKQAVESVRSVQVSKYKKDAQEELIEEKLKMQEARKLGIEVSDQDVQRIIKNIAEKNKVTEAQFAQNLKNMGTDISVMKTRFTAGLAWREVIRRKFAAQISINQRDVDRLMAQSRTETGEDTVELTVQKISLPLPAKIDQAAMAQRLADADALRRRFGGCKSTAQLAATLPGAKFEDQKALKPSAISEPTRSFLLNAKDGEMLPPQTSGSGIDIYAVCSRREVKVDDKKREEAQAELQSREFEQLAKRHLRDLRQDAHIETR